jgi:hypothetical protein
MATKDPLRFKVASHIVQDLGLNLYTSLPRVLVEFVANAYDADSPSVAIRFDRTAIEKQRKAVKAEFDRDRALADEDEPEVPLALRTLDDGITISITDRGIGMSRADIQDKFLVAGRRRRDEDNSTTDNGRAVMGRKGLGKLAGFGIAKKLEIYSRKKGEDAIKITLDYDELEKCKTTEGFEVPEAKPSEIPGLPAAATGTVVVLSKLLYDPTKSRDTTIENEIGDHFALIDPEDFRITVNGKDVSPTPRRWDYGWPDPEKPVSALVAKTLEIEDGVQVDFKYRLRFTKLGKGLPARERGVRIYANKRLAAAPSLLDADTNMHGFRMTDYLDGVVHADFIDQQPLDYIATDRHGLRWDAPMLSKLREFLSAEIKEACKKFQQKRDADNDDQVGDDPFTKGQIEAADLSAGEKKLAMKIAKALGKAYDDGIEDESYKVTLPSIVQAIGRGGILTAISKLAEQDKPQLGRLVVEITRLTKDEMDSFTTRAKVRLAAIRAMKKVVNAADFRSADNEKEIQKLLEKNPWLIDATYTQFLSADKRMDSVLDRLAKQLKIGAHSGAKYDAEKRPDLVFLLGGAGLGRIVIVELKSANKPLNNDHLVQLELYMEEAEEFLKANHLEHVKVEGHLIGTRAPASSSAEKVVALRRRTRKAGPTESWQVRDYLDVLTDTEAAHKELLDIQSNAENDDDDGEEEEE